MSAASLHPTTDSSPLIVRELVCGYGNRAILGPLDFTLEPGSFMLIEGPNGAGKSTLLKTIIGLIPPISGTYTWNIDREHLRFVPQTRTLDPMLPATVKDVLMTGQHHGRGFKSLRITRDTAAIQQVLEIVEMATFKHHLFRELSEGQKQLILIARALLGHPKVILLDEPSASMDPEREAHTLQILQKIQRTQQVAMLMIAHGSKPARRASNHIMTIDRQGHIHLGPGECSTCDSTH